jgi:hypothetical protein
VPVRIGLGNVLCWCERQGLPSDPDLVSRVLALAKSSNRVLRDEEIFALVIQRAS